MKLTDLFIRRPVVALVVNLVIVIAGRAGASARSTCGSTRAARTPTITVTTAYVGASAELVRGFITTPLERVIAAADGIDYIESQSRQSVSTIRARLRLNYDSTKALSRDQLQGRPGPRRPAARGRRCRSSTSSPPTASSPPPT